MLKFDLNQNPPTAEEIAAERQNIEHQRTVFKRKAWMPSIIAVAIFAAAWMSGWLTGKELFVVVAAVVAGVSAVAGGVAAGITGVVVVGFTVGIVGFGVVGFAVFGVFAGVCAVVGVFAVVGVVAVLFIDDLLGNSELSSLDVMAPIRCEQLLADCLADPLCEAYRQKVAALGRKPVEVEAEMIHARVVQERALAADREKDRLAAEKDRREGIACALVSSKEPLMSDADKMLKGEQPTC